MARIGLGVKRPLTASASESAIIDIAKINPKGKGKEEVTDGGAKKRAKRNGDGQEKNPNETLKDLGKNSRVGNKSEATFKIPPLPPPKREKNSVKGKSSQSLPEPDVFDFTFEPENSSAMSEMETHNKGVSYHLYSSSATNPCFLVYEESGRTPHVRSGYWQTTCRV